MSIFVHPRRETRREQPLEVETSGLLSVLAPGFLEDLMRHGYRPGPAAKQLQVMSHLRPVARRAIWILSHATPPRPGAGRSARAWPEALSFVSYPRAGSYVAINTPVRIVTLSRSWSDASTPRGKSLSLERPAISARTIVSLPPPLVARSGRRPSAAAIAPRPATPGRSHRPAGSCQWRDRSGTEGLAGAESGSQRRFRFDPADAGNQKSLGWSLVGDRAAAVDYTRGLPLLPDC
jgi:hypothetical protein